LALHQKRILWLHSRIPCTPQGSWPFLGTPHVSSVWLDPQLKESWSRHRLYRSERPVLFVSSFSSYWRAWLWLSLERCHLNSSSLHWSMMRSNFWWCRSPSVNEETFGWTLGCSACLSHLRFWGIKVRWAAKQVWYCSECTCWSHNPGHFGIQRIQAPIGGHLPSAHCSFLELNLWPSSHQTRSWRVLTTIWIAIEDFYLGL
jgi:hypothetical protein